MKTNRLSFVPFILACAVGIAALAMGSPGAPPGADPKTPAKLGKITMLPAVTAPVADSAVLAQLKLIKSATDGLEGYTDSLESYLAPTTPYSNIGGGDTGLVVVASAKTLRFFTLSNGDSGAVWVKVYDKATAASAADTPKFRVLVPAGGTVVQTSRATFSAGISFRVVTEATDAGTTGPNANKVNCNFEYN